ncbi:MAG: helix-turn-helix domain-containing protein [Gemmatimonadaceae bacterium]|nr:helix-turn-helix domain-containing protein [Gemmatimonadaceae bacterium]
MHNTVAEVFPPGEYLREELDARGWTQEEFADIIGRSYKQVNELLGGKAALTAPMAAAIAAALGTSAELWLNLESTFRLSLAEPVSHDVARRGRLRTEFPVREMQKRGWIPKLEKPENIDQLERCVYDFFAIAESDGHSPYASAAKRADYTTALTRTQEAIVLRVRQLASRLRPEPYGEEALRHCIEQLKDLRADANGVRQVPDLLALAGVRFVVCEPFAGSKLDGICTWLDAHSPVIGMTLRLDRIDNFWFVLRHEIEHVLRRDGLVNNEPGAVIDEDLSNAVGDGVPAAEIAANIAATEFCLPTDAMQTFIDRVGPLYSKSNVRECARANGVHPGLVVGQLQRRLNRWDLFRPMLVKVRESLTSVALTDGYGRIVA